MRRFGFDNQHVDDKRRTYADYLPGSCIQADRNEELVSWIGRGDLDGPEDPLTVES